MCDCCQSCGMWIDIWICGIMGNWIQIDKVYFLTPTLLSSLNKQKSSELK